MRRDYKGKEQHPQPVGLIFHAPFTDDAVDIISGRTPLSQVVASYSSDGVFLNGTHIKYEFTKDEALSVKTVYLEIKPNAFTNPYGYIYHFGNGEIQYSNRYRDSTAVTSGKQLWKTIGCSSASNDKDTGIGKSVVKLQTYKIATVFRSDSQVVYVNGEKIWTNSKIDRWTNWSDNTCHLTIGGQFAENMARTYNGYVKDFKLYNKQFSDAELAQMTSL